MVDAFVQRDLLGGVKHKQCNQYSLSRGVYQTMLQSHQTEVPDSCEESTCVRLAGAEVKERTRIYVFNPDNDSVFCFAVECNT